MIRPMTHKTPAPPVLTAPVMAALAETHPDPFVQAAVWTLWNHAPGLLDHDVVLRLAKAQAGQ